MDPIDAVFIIAVIMFSAVIHEVAHGVAADKLGDPTARLMGRLTLNPIPHLDIIGSIFLPLVLALSGSPFLFGWAKPVPYNPYNFVRAPRWGEAIVAGAGPASNFLIALVAASLVRTGWFSPEITSIVFLIIVINVMLGIFNLVPIPPLDGSKVLSALLPAGLADSYGRLRTTLEFNPFLGLGLVILFIIFLGGDLARLIYTVAGAFAGI
ncbi:site-2 protease family protein [Candidatus Kaiserbacteria bacterium CG10_big_fil_rev_8_21_14_0_10_59_10]|uniref:Site-2 protease family protein n=1 Tax=Candidatus Kaiserbacteria bacterium CG10_big_fil_rev_8_21_14_0_10_59_10 TaxID=1974612 RepID=A0A2H0UAF2_9BACT|nr:MAG: site-2 protease family protein [Candidatus Kaiserbacteria bacterium CG10_big_fil_rev_8_21_14_0_10_59_10]